MLLRPDGSPFSDAELQRPKQPDARQSADHQVNLGNHGTPAEDKTHSKPDTGKNDVPTNMQIVAEKDKSGQRANTNEKSTNDKSRPGPWLAFLVPNVIQFLLFIATTGAFIAALLYADIADRQRMSSDMQLGALLHQVHVSEWANELARESSDESWKQSQAALNASNKALRLDQRAWMGFQSTDLNLKEGETFTLTHWLVNTGKTPAIEVTARASTTWVFRGDHFTPVYQLTPHEYPTSKTMVMPLQRIFIPGTADRVTSHPVMLAIANGTVRLYLFGEMCYSDVFHAPHHVTFCEFLLPDAKTLQNCEVYNTTDDQQHTCE